MTDIEGMDQEDHSPAGGPAKGNGLVTTGALSPIAGRMEHLFPTLTAAQTARVAAHGRVRAIREGETLVEAGDHVVPFFLVTAGVLEVVRPLETGDTLVAVHLPGQFSGEVNMIWAPRALRVRVRESGTVIGRSRPPGDARPDRRRSARS